jgi:3-oxoacyl-[acyl-carrier-protein] synthase III
LKPFVINRHGRMVLPSNIFPEIDFSALDSLEQFSSVVKRDFEEKAPTATDIVDRIQAGNYKGRYELLRDLGLHLFWVNRYSITMYEKRPTVWRNVPKHRPDVFLPIVTPWLEGKSKISMVRTAFQGLPSTWNDNAEDKIFELLFDIFSNKRHHAGELPAIKPTVAEILANPGNMTFQISQYDPDFPSYSYEQIIDCDVAVPELEALTRWAMVLHNQYPWQRQYTRLVEVGKLRDDDIVPVFYPRNREVMQFILRVKARRPNAVARPAPAAPESPVRAYPPLDITSARFPIKPRIAALAVVKGEVPCSNEDLVRNAAYNWSPMSAQDVAHKTGIFSRTYTARSLEDISLEAARRAVEQAGCRAADIGAVVFCTCTSAKLIPSIATWISGELGLLQTHASVDLVAACAGLAYGLAESVRLLQEVDRPVLLVCGEKFSDKIGSVRTSRMIFGDGAAALVIAPVKPGAATDIEFIQTYASGPHTEVNSIIWPNPEFDNNITVYGPDVQSLVRRYLGQMMAELQQIRDPANAARSVLESIELVVPHQANQTMVTKLATAAGLAADRLYFNIGKVGNTSSASIPLALFDAVEEGVIKAPCRIFAPSFGAGAVAGYIVMRFDPAVVARGVATRAQPAPAQAATIREGSTVSDVQSAFGS